MTEIVIFTASGIFLYLGANAALDLLERLHDEPLPYRNVVFFFIILTMALILFPIINMLFSGGGTS